MSLRRYKTPLNAAVIKGDVEEVKRILNTKEGLSTLNTFSRYKYTPLYHAYREGKMDIFKLLLISRADPNLRLNGGKLVFEGNIEAVKLLLDVGVDIHVNKNEDDKWVEPRSFDYSASDAIIQYINNYTPSLQALAKRSIISNKINVLALPMYT